jgi:hypothetical protein
MFSRSLVNSEASPTLSCEEKLDAHQRECFKKVNKTTHYTFSRDQETCIGICNSHPASTTFRPFTQHQGYD